MSETKREQTGMSELRTIVAALDHCREGFLDRFSVDELVQIHRMWVACGWDFFPDQWTEGQVKAALAGKAPQWDPKTEKPIEETCSDSFGAYRCALPAGHEGLHDSGGSFTKWTATECCPGCGWPVDAPKCEACKLGADCKCRGPV